MKRSLAVLCSAAFICAVGIGSISGMEEDPQKAFTREFQSVADDKVMCPGELTNDMIKEFEQQGFFTWRGVRFKIIGGKEGIEAAKKEFFRKEKTVEGTGWFGTNYGAKKEVILPPAYYVGGLQRNFASGSVIRANYTFQTPQAKVLQNASQSWGIGGLISGVCYVAGSTTTANNITIVHLPGDEGKQLPGMTDLEINTAKEILGYERSANPSNLDLMERFSQLIELVHQKGCKENLQDEKLRAYVRENTKIYEVAYEVLSSTQVDDEYSALKKQQNQMRAELKFLDEQKKKLANELAQGTQDLGNMKAEQTALRKQREQDQAKIQELEIELKTGRKPEGITYGGMGEQHSLKQVLPSTKSSPSIEETRDQKKLRETREKLEKQMGEQGTN